MDIGTIKEAIMNLIVLACGFIAGVWIGARMSREEE